MASLREHVPFRTWIPLASRGARPEHVQSSRSKVISGQFCGPCGYPNQLFPVWGSSGPLLGPCWAFLRHFVGPLERARGSVWPSWDFLCVTREAFPHSRRAVVDSHPKCRNQHWRSHGKRSKPALAQSWKKRFSRHLKASGGVPEGSSRGFWAPWRPQFGPEMGPRRGPRGVLEGSPSQVGSESPLRPPLGAVLGLSWAPFGPLLGPSWALLEPS